MLKKYETQENYKYKLPKIIIDNNNSKRNDHYASEEDRRVKNITLTNYNKYIKDYTNSLKYPLSNYYSTDKLKHSIAFKILNNTNLNKKINFLSTFNEFNLNKKTTIFRTNLNNYNDAKNSKRLLSYSSFETQDLKYFDLKFYLQKTDEEILKYFLEGTFLRKPQHLKYIGINEKSIYPHILNTSDFEFYSSYLENLNKNENLTDYKNKSYELNDMVNYNKLNFILDLKSICFQFEEININNLENNKNENNSNLNENNNDNKIDKNIQNLNLPFKYLPLLFLLNYQDFKLFINEIISFDFKNNSFNFVKKEDLEDIIKKYCDNCKNKLLSYTEEKNTKALNNCILYENEFHYNNEFFWFIYDEDNNERIKTFKLKIVYPLIEFKMDEFKIKFKRYCNKWLLLELVKENFNCWDRYILFTLFINKYLRKSISNILNKKKEYYLFINKSHFIGPLINNYFSKKNNFDFFVTEINLNINHYYFVVPYHASITKKYRETLEKNDTIYLQLNNARKIYQLSEFFGLMGIFNKCMFYNKYKKTFYFSLKILEDINDDYISFLKEQKNQFIITNNDTKNIFKFNGSEYHLIITDCSLCEKKLDINDNYEYKYYKIPDKLYEFILGDSMNNENEIISNLINNLAEIINSNEIIEKSISVSKTKSFKSLKSMKRKETMSSFKSFNSQFVNDKNKFSKLKSFKEDKKFEKDFSPISSNKKKISSFQNVRIYANKQNEKK